MPDRGVPHGATVTGSGPELLRVEDLRVVFTRRGEPLTTAVDGVSFTVRPGEVVGLVGESGCGKTVTSLAIMGLLPRSRHRVDGRVLLDGADLLGLPEDQIRARRGRDIGMVFQDPLAALNPVVPIGLQVAEVLRRHRGEGRRESMRSAADLLHAVGVPDPRRRLREYPYQFSGGMLQRALIAVALAGRPRLLIADEPTAALDVTIQAQILALLSDLVRQTGMALIVVTHDLGVVARVCDQVNVLYAGRVVETAERRTLFARPRHPYTYGLLGSVPRLDAPRGTRLAQVPGSVSGALPWSQGCAFAPRCERVLDRCRSVTPPLVTHDWVAFRCHNPVPTHVLT
jgi:peptide/nickel transport system ATP-binding protein